MASNSPPSPENTTKAISGTVPANAAAPGASASAPETKATAGAPAKSGSKPNGRTATRRTSAAKSSAHDNSAHAKKSDGEAIAMLKQDHRRVEKLFAEYEKAGDDRKDAIIQDVCHALTLHTMLEEEVFYPACRHAARDEDPLDEAQVEHDSAKVLIADLVRARRDDPFRDAKVKVLAEQILHHVKEEEGDDGIFARAGKAGVDTPELAAQLKELRSELEAEDRLPPQAPVSFGASPRAEARNTQERTMASYQGRDNGGRDDRGRFAGQGGRYREDDDHRGGRSSQDRPRDEEGRFMSDDRGRSSRSHDDDRDYRGRSSSSRDDDRGGRSGNRGHGGWFGDPEGHSQASRKGWERSDHEGSGWYGDSRGHSEASRRGWENSDHEGSGWYGDPRGHSEASRRGWDDRDRSSRGSSGRHDDDDRRSRYSRDDDDDDRGGRRGGRDDDRGHGGWFGDSRGHSEASRKGWDNRH
ncbi:hemerythrin domain-containing protein [Novosphingobium pokkalii]|nr:hypothetical protein GCM10019060_03230 [Novosphingobium pokkalii]